MHRKTHLLIHKKLVLSIEKYRSVILVAAIMLQALMTFGQNLIVNPSFEIFNKCPEELGNINDDVFNWSTATEGTTDYFNECSVPMGVPKNFNGSQVSEFGTGYAGLYLMAPNDYREYLQGELSETMIKGQRYRIGFYISLAEKSNFAISDIGLLFSRNRMEENTRRQLKLSRDKNNSYNFIEVGKGKYYADKSEWMHVQREIVANGTENYFTIGNFKNNSNTKTFLTKGVKSAAYYYLDMVSVVTVGENYPFDDLRKNRMYVLKNVLFPTNEYDLGEEAKPNLKKLYNELKKNTSFFITVHAHTDDDGSRRDNKILSENRAKAVAGYLISLGLGEHRIRWIGHGGENPLAENGTEKGKQKNRRAEFIISDNPFDGRDFLTETLFKDDD